MARKIRRLILIPLAVLCFGGNGAGFLIAAENTRFFAAVTAGNAGKGSSTSAALKLSGVFCDSMVLQRDMPAPVFGRGSAGEKATVEFARQTKQTQADEKGRWCVALDPLSASAEGRIMTVRAAFGVMTLSNIMVGEVWFCSGQSNMALTLGEAGHAQEEQAFPANPQLREFSASRYYAVAPSDEIRNGHWHPVTPSNVGGLCATAYYFGELVHRDLKVPVVISFNSSIQ